MQVVTGLPVLQCNSKLPGWVIIEERTLVHWENTKGVFKMSNHYSEQGWLSSKWRLSS